MIYRRSLSLLALILVLVFPGAVGERPSVLAGYEPGDLTDEFVLPDDLEITLWAESPQFYNPTNIDVDARGRVWVTEAVNYRDFNNHDGHLRHEAGDRVVILEDTDGNGKADRSTVFVQDEDLRSPLGVAVIGEKVVVSSAPNLIVYTDADGDDRPEHKEILLTGFGGYDHDHALHSLVAGPDGQWYFNTGNAGPHVVTDRSGWTLRSGSIYTGGSPYNTENRGGMMSDDGRVWVGGLALRMRPDGTGLEVLAHNFRNAYELAIDSYGNLWQNDNDDEVMACRVTWVMEGANQGFFSRDGARSWQADRRPGQNTFTAHWHQDDPGVAPAGDNTGAGSPTGMVVYEGDALGKKYRGMLLSADAGRNAVFAYWPEPDGAGFKLERTNLVATKRAADEGYVWNDAGHERDLQRWFRPSDVAVGPDGAIYVADWYDPVVGGHQMHDRGAYGRIYRIAPKGKALRTPDIDLSTQQGQIEALLNPAPNVRSLGFARLKASGERVLDDVAGLLTHSNSYYRARAVWLMAQLGPNGFARVEDLLDDPDPALRVTAFRAIRRQAEDVLPYARKLARDVSPAVRREVAIALRDVPFEQAQNMLLDLARGFDGGDRWYLEAFGTASEGKEEQAYAMLLEAFGAEPLAWDARMAGLAWRLHPVASIDAFTRRASSARVPEAERQRALTALGFIDAPAAAQAMADLTHSELPDVAQGASWWMQYRKTNDWHAYPVEGWTVAVPATASRSLQDNLNLQQTVLDTKGWITERIDAAQEMASDPLGGLLLIGQARKGKLAYQVNWGVSATIFNNPDPTVRALARNYFDPPGGAQPYDPAEIVRIEADRDRGQAVFYANCASCHRAGDLGGDIGPDLTAIGEKFDRAALIDAIVRPGAAVMFGYEPWYVSLKDGGAVAGLLLSDGPMLVLKDATGRQHTIRGEDVAEREQLRITLMPDPVGMGLSEQDVADVSEYLLSLQAN